MSDQVIVTLCFDQTEKDFALPAKIPLKELYPRLLAVLGNVDETYRQAAGICLRRADGFLIDPDATLLDYGVKNGARLTVSMEG